MSGLPDVMDWVREKREAKKKEMLEMWKKLQCMLGSWGVCCDSNAFIQYEGAQYILSSK